MSFYDNEQEIISSIFIIAFKLENGFTKRFIIGCKETFSSTDNIHFQNIFLSPFHNNALKCFDKYFLINRSAHKN